MALKWAACRSPGVYFVHSDWDYQVNITFNIVLNQPTLISEPTLSNTINIFPNPFTNKILLDIHNQRMEEISIYVTNLMGDIVYKSKENISSMDFRKEIEFAYLSKGVYFLEALIGDERITRKLIKD